MRSQLKKLYLLFDESDRIKFLILIILMLIVGLSELLSIGAIPAFLGVLLNPGMLKDIPVLNNFVQYIDMTDSKKLLIFGCIAILLAFIIKNSIFAFYFFTRTRFVSNRMANLRKKLFEAYMYAPYSFFLQRNTAELLRNANIEALNICKTALLPLLEFMSQFIIAAFIITMLIVAQPIATFVMMFILGLAGMFFIVKLNHKINQLGKIALDERGNSNKCVKHGIEGIKEAKILNAEKSFVSEFYKSAKRAANAFKTQDIIYNINAPILEITGIFTMILIILLVVNIYDWNLEKAMPMLALFAVSMARLRTYIVAFIRNFTKLRYNLVSVEPVYNDLKLLKNNTKQRHPQNQKSELKLNNEIKIENLSFCYEKTDIPAVKNLNLEIPYGSSVAFVGSTGAGKTTIIDLILGLLEPSEGKITVDRKNVHENLRAWQNNIGYIPQFIYLLDADIKSNIALGIAENKINQEQLEKAVSAAQLNDFVSKLPNGLDTFVGERGVRLSGGQRQRIGIARAIYHNPDILVMDEATSSLDNSTEKAIVESVNRLKGDRTIITIAHRLSTVKNCDKLFFMKDGILEHEGKYEYLLEKSEDFRKMADKQ